MTYGRHLKRSRHGVLYFRFVLPEDLRRSLGKTEICLSLGKVSKREAEVTALELTLTAKSFVAAARTSHEMSSDESKHALGQLIAERRLAALKAEFSSLQEVQTETFNEKQRLQAKLADLAGTARSPASSERLSTAITLFKTERRATGSWTPKTSAMWDSRLRLLLEWLGDVSPSALTRSAMVEFFEALKLLPKNANKQIALVGLTMRALTVVPGVERISSSTVNQIMECMSGFIGWMDSDRSRWGIDGNSAKGLVQSNVKSDVRLPLSTGDLEALLSSQEWTERTFLHSYCYWLLPFGLFTGARINELCQLGLDDFREEHGYAVVDICAVGKRGKNDPSRRTVPLHSELIRLGLVRHVVRLRARGETMLFPECAERRDGHGQDPSRWFGRFKKRAGITDPLKVFHSARHGFSSQLFNSGTDETTGAPKLPFGAET